MNKKIEGQAVAAQETVVPEFGKKEMIELLAERLNEAQWNWLDENSKKINVTRTNTFTNEARTYLVSDIAAEIENLSGEMIICFGDQDNDDLDLTSLAFLESQLQDVTYDVIEELGKSDVYKILVRLKDVTIEFETV